MPPSQGWKGNWGPGEGADQKSGGREGKQTAGFFKNGLRKQQESSLPPTGFSTCRILVRIFIHSFNSPSSVPGPGLGIRILVYRKTDKSLAQDDSACPCESGDFQVCELAQRGSSPYYGGKTLLYPHLLASLSLVTAGITL